MTGCNITRLILLLTILHMVVTRLAYGSPVISDNLVLNCDQSESAKKLNCDYRLKSAEIPHSISARSGNKSLTLTTVEYYPWKDAVTAILFLVDTSDPGRQNVIDQNKNDIQKILDSSGQHHMFGLASFNKSLKTESAIGSTKEQIINAASQLRATGQTTELYRSLLAAIDELKKIKADRKSIFIFSDGLVEDTAYYHQDVVHAANDADIIITSLGYPRSVALSVGLQTLRRLSDETGGVFFETDMSFKLPDNFLNNPLASLDNGGKFVIDINQLTGYQARQSSNIYLDFNTADNIYTAEIPVTLPANVVPGLAVTSPGQPTGTAVQQQPVLSQPVQQPVVVNAETPERKPVSWLWYGIPVALIILLIITIIIAFFMIMRNQGSKKQSETGNFSKFRPFAYLVVQDETKKRYPITNTTWRIGRGTDNEMTLRDSSVSRRHAEIDRDKGDVFTIIDLDSTNGVYVNNEKIHKRALREGDIIEIGDINFRFTLLPAEYSFEEVTEMQNTRSPFTH